MKPKVTPITKQQTISLSLFLSLRSKLFLFTHLGGTISSSFMRP